MISRRAFMIGLGLAPLVRAARADSGFEIALGDDEWRERLTPAQFDILRGHATEHAFTNAHLGEHSPLLAEARPGTYTCAGCGNPVYRSEAKYDSGTGWPSFWDAIEGGVVTRDDYRLLFFRRTEVHCARCGGHLGHIFEDGPPPTGLRHCLNGLAMGFMPDQSVSTEKIAAPSSVQKYPRG